MRYVVRPAGCVAWGESDSLGGALSLLREARARGLRNVTVYDTVEGRETDYSDWATVEADKETPNAR